MAQCTPPLARKPPNLADDLPIAQVALLSGVLYRTNPFALRRRDLDSELCLQKRM